MKGRLQRDGVWDQPNVDEAAAYDVTAEEYEAWVERRGIELILCDQNYQFEELAKLRRQGVAIVGRFVWEMFERKHLEGARDAYDLVYSMTRCEQERYRGWGLETPYVPWGIHPELLAVAGQAALSRGRRAGDLPGRASSATASRSSLRSRRSSERPIRRLRLLVKAQVERKSHERRPRGRRARPPDRVPAHRPADRRAPRDLRRLRRLPHPGSLGGTRPAALRGDGLRDAGDHQRLPAAQRGHRGRPQRHPRRQRAARHRRVRDSRLRPRHRGADRRDRADRRRRGPRAARGRRARGARGACLGEDGRRASAG